MAVMKSTELIWEAYWSTW